MRDFLPQLGFLSIVSPRCHYTEMRRYESKRPVYCVYYPRARCALPVARCWWSSSWRVVWVSSWCWWSQCACTARRWNNFRSPTRQRTANTSPVQECTVNTWIAHCHVQQTEHWSHQHVLC